MCPESQEYLDPIYYIYKLVAKKNPPRLKVMSLGNFQKA